MFKSTSIVFIYYYYVNSIFCTDYLSGEIIVGRKKKLSIYFFEYLSYLLIKCDMNKYVTFSVFLKLYI